MALNWILNPFTGKLDATSASGGGGSSLYTREAYSTPGNLTANGVTPPTWKQFKNDGSTGTDGALKYNSTYATMASYTELGTAIDGAASQFTVEFWIKPTRLAYEYVASLGSNAGIRLDNSGGNPALRLDFGSTYVLTQPIQIGAWNHIVIVVDNSIRQMYVYTNNQYSTSTTGTGTIAQQNPIEFGVGSDPAATAEHYISEFLVYDMLLTADQVAERWNSGSGTTNLPTGVLETDLAMYLSFEDGSGSTITNTRGNDATIVGTEGVDYEWTTGPIGGSGSFGVFLPAFSAGLGQYSGITIPVPPDWSLNTDITAHLHFSIAQGMSAGETITFEFEYTLAREDEIFGNTTVSSATYTATGSEVSGEHLELVWPVIAVPGTGPNAPQIVAMLKRVVNDTFTGDVFFVNLGIEYTADY